MNSREIKSVLAQLRHARVQPSKAAWQFVKRAFDRGARTPAQLTKGLSLVRDGKGQLWALTPREDAELRAAVVAAGGRVKDAVEEAREQVRTIMVAVATAVVGTFLLALAILLVRLLP